MRAPAIALWLALLQSGFAADAEYKIVRIEAVEHEIKVRLPLTDVTGKVRVKEHTSGGMGAPISPLHTKLDGNDYLEWQIGYDTVDAQNPSLAAGVVFQRKGLTKYGTELSKILVEALRIGIITKEQLRHERDFLTKARAATLEETEKIAVEKTPRSLGGFSEFVERVPMFSKEEPDGRIEIELKPKQRAVGYQAMIYVCLNMTAVLTPDGAPRPPGPAHSKETVEYRFTKTNADFLFDIVSAFGIASQQHNEDLTHILDCVLGNP